MAHKNKRRGNRWERDGVKWWSRLLNLIPYHPKSKENFDISTTRHMSKGMDDMGIDIWFNPSSVSSHLLRIKDQRKEQQSNGNATSIRLDALLNMKVSKNDLPMLFTRVTHKTEGGRTMIDQEVVTMKIEDFEEIIRAWHLLQYLKELTPVYEYEEELTEILGSLY